MNTPKIKKLLLIFAGISTFLVIAILIFLYINNRTSQNTPVDEIPQEESSEALSATVLSTPVVDVVLDPNRNTIKFYQLSDGQAGQIPAIGGNPQIIDTTTLTNLTSVDWAPSAPYTLTNVNGRFYSFNFSTKKVFSLPLEVTSAQFLSDNRILYTFKLRSGLVDLSLVNPDGSGRQTIITLTSDAVFLKPIPFQNKVSQTLVPSASRASSLSVIDFTTKEAKQLISEKNGLNVSWAPDGKIGIISYTTERGGGTMALSIIDNNGFEISRLPDTGTIAEKITWTKDGKFAYFTKPEIANNRIMPDDYYGNKLGDFSESLYKIDITAKTITKVYDSIGNVDSRDLFLNTSEDTLFFINKKDNLLYKVSL